MLNQKRVEERGKMEGIGGSISDESHLFLSVAGTMKISSTAGPQERPSEEAHAGA